MLLPFYYFFLSPFNNPSNNFTNMAVIIRYIYENTKQNVELFENYKEMVNAFFTSTKNLYLKYLENEQERNLLVTFFLASQSQQQQEQPKKFKTEEERDKTLFSFYF